MKTVILCGGRGLRFGDAEVPKPMQLVGGQPLLWHIMQWYASHGHREFVLCTGWRHDVISEWVAGNVDVGTDVSAWCVETGLETQTGGRLLRVKELLGDRFMVAYGDCLSDVPINDLATYHLSHGRAATITVVQPTLPWGVVDMNLGDVVQFTEKPRYNRWCNGGFMIADRRLFGYIQGDQATLEQALALMAQDNQLCGFKHGGFWRGCDTEKDRRELDTIWESGDAPWGAR